MKKQFKGFVIGVFVTLILTSTIAFAGGVKQKIDVVLNSINLTVNGKAVKADNILYKGTTYVPIREVGEILGKDVTWDAKTNTAGINDKGFKEPSTGNAKNQNGYDKSKTGNLEGNITWQYNKFIGTKADTGAKICLIPTNLSKESDNSFFTIALKQIPNGENGIYTAEADGYGSYKMQDIPAGEYYLLISSNNTYSDMTINSWDESRLKAIFSDSDWEKLENGLKSNKYHLKTIQIEENKTKTESYDFGYTYF